MMKSRSRNTARHKPHYEHHYATHFHCPPHQHDKQPAQMHHGLGLSENFPVDRDNRKQCAHLDHVTLSAFLDRRSKVSVMTNSTSLIRKRYPEYLIIIWISSSSRYYCCRLEPLEEVLIYIPARTLF